MGREAKRQAYGEKVAGYPVKPPSPVKGAAEKKVPAK
jgi:hypothetical protein